MVKNYFKTAFRSLLKNKFYTGINIIGLAVGLSTCLTILLYVLDELNYDKFNTKADRIYRLNYEIKFGQNYGYGAQGPAPMGPEIVKEFPQVEQYTRLRWRGGFLVKKGENNIQEGSVAYADSTLFDLFTLPVIDGNPKTALTEPHSMVITESIARKYFNRTDVAGKTLTINNKDVYKITAVIKDIPSQSHFRFDFFLPLIENPDSRNDDWLSENYNTYILLRKGASPDALTPQLDAMNDRFIGPELQNVIHLNLQDFKKGGGFVKISLFPLMDIHLHSNKEGELYPNGSIQFIYIFSSIAIFILLIACVNFMNLATARSANRAKEVGVRKVLGSLRRNLIQQFLAESLMISFIALVLAIGIACLMLPYFNQLAEKQIQVWALFQPGMLLSLLALMFLVGLLAGSYPAFVLSAFKPVEVLKGKLASGFKGSRLKNSLVVFQFVISIILIVSTIVIYSQLGYIRNRDIGFNRKQVLIINGTGSLGNRADAFKEELLHLKGVQAITMSGFLPTNFARNNNAFFTSPAFEQSSSLSMQDWGVDENYIPTLGIQLELGRNFSSQFPTDSGAVIINEAAAKRMGNKNLINKPLYQFADIQTKKVLVYHIIGVMKNFNFSTLRDAVSPLGLFLKKADWSISVRYNVSDQAEVVEEIRNKWRSFVPEEPFDYAFMDDQFNDLYRGEKQTGQIFITFAILAILIASLGLFGLVTYAAAQRTREIGIRKVLGATVSGIMVMIIKDFLKLVLIASLIAFPFGWWAMYKWLEGFAYRVAISWWIFLTAAILAVFIALLTVSYQSIRAALANPAKSLRSD
jgi:putative ABC transport system permease protein